MSRIHSLADVVDWRMCLGCGACAYICPQHVRLIDFLDEGIRPVVEKADCAGCRECLAVCPAVQSDFRKIDPSAGIVDESFEKEWGPVAGIWEGAAADADIRYRGSSGGALTAISAYCVEKLG